MTATKEKPILFSGEMVRAILDGRKTQTRRIVKPQPPTMEKLACGQRNCHGALLSPGDVGIGRCHYSKTGWSFDLTWSPDNAVRGCCCVSVKCPYEVGTRLWVKEAWGHRVDAKGKCCIAYKADGSARYALADFGGEGDLCELGGPADPWLEPGMPWRHSIHMPRWASRITLEITDIRVQRLQEISHHDALAEGCENTTHASAPLLLKKQPLTVAQLCYSHLWDSINTKPGTRWEDNPWVWVYTFRRVEE